ncbi:IMPACT family protein [Larsenimonas rhizosphaerae]|uniref:IMPACT family protein n=1 Tax=Larsenimonas rhizosphaerae TaxID=2944682 RepID=UPI0020338D91|nr:YigZ family protein [Larsenimonas rhizosphaerae]MCM2129997.1 YigZ family protein [Larsenimonas rhizosphaerae]
MAYEIPANEPDAPWVVEFEVQKSRFITWAAHTPAPADAQALLQRARAHFPDARHHCLAFIAGPPGEQRDIGFSDDGEPGGTAGRPMYQALEGSGLGHIGCVAIRYFGGIKLGTGGLARAYTKSVTLALEQLPTITHVPRHALWLDVSFAGEQEARFWIEQQAGKVTDAEYTAQGVRLALQWPNDTPCDIAPLKARLAGEATLITSTHAE